MLDKLKALKAETLKKLEETTDTESLRQLKNAVIGKKGEITIIKRSIGQLSPEERPAVGQLANEIAEELEAAFAEREELVKAHEMAKNLEESEIDVTLPGRPVARGRLHPTTRMLRDIYDIWADMGFQVYRSRDVEDDDTNFTLLNIPPHHPARDMWDTFYTTDEGVILRTHTSPGQIRAMRDFAPEPIRVILPGMCYRYEQISARSEVQFNQLEGLAIGKNIRMTDLKGTIAEFARRMYGAERKVRYRCSHFPFTEPSMEVDVECVLCDGEGCGVCKYTGWLEICGSGMVHPVVLKNGGYDPAVYSGFAFGFGPERMAMLRYGIQDIRYFWGNDLRFLEQF
jgi:phenylalanyl-tRNA synthetase alpha chain